MDSQTKKSNYGDISSLALVLILVAGDYLAVLLAEHLAMHLRNFIMHSSMVLTLGWESLYIVFPGFFILFANLKGLYNKPKQFWQVLNDIFITNIYAILGIVAYMYMQKDTGATSRLFIIFFWIISFFVITIIRWILKKIVMHCEFLRSPILSMGAGKTAAILIDYLQNDTGLGLKFIGYLEDGTPDKKLSERLPHLGGFADAERVIQETGVRKVMLMAPGLSGVQTQEIIYRLQPLVDDIHFIPDMGVLPLTNINITSLVDGHVVMIGINNNLSKWYNRYIKYSFDFILTLVGIIFISPLLAYIAYKIHKDSPGPIIYSGMRVGQDGKEFPCYKFRSMCVNADKMLDGYLAEHPGEAEEYRIYKKLKNDPRVTKIGAFLRRTSLDELPQIFNVLRGEMSLVGPRPYLPQEIPELGMDASTILAVRPGITGMWQTSGRNDLEFEGRVQLEAWYVRNWNLWFDVVLLWRTIKVVLWKKGAY